MYALRVSCAYTRSLIAARYDDEVVAAARPLIINDELVLQFARNKCGHLDFALERERELFSSFRED